MGDALRLMLEQIEEGRSGLEREPLSREELHRVNRALRAVAEAADRPDEKHPETWWALHKQGVDLGGEKVYPHEAQRATLTEKERRAFDFELLRSRAKHTAEIDKKYEERANEANRELTQPMIKTAPVRGSLLAAAGIAAAPFTGGASLLTIPGVFSSPAAISQGFGEMRPLGVGPALADLSRVLPGDQTKGRYSRMSEKQRAQFDQGVAEGTMLRIEESVRASNPDLTDQQVREQAAKVQEGGFLSKIKHAPGVAMAETVGPAALWAFGITKASPLMLGATNLAGAGLRMATGAHVMANMGSLATRASLAIGESALGLGAYEALRTPQEDEKLLDQAAGSLRSRLERATRGLVGGAALGAAGTVVRGIGASERAVGSVANASRAARAGIAGAKAAREFVAQFGEGAGYSLANGHFDMDQLLVDSTVFALGGGIHALTAKAAQSVQARKALARAAEADKKIATEIRAARGPHEFEQAMADSEGVRDFEDMTARLAAGDAPPPPGPEQVKADAIGQEEAMLRRFRDEVAGRMKMAPPDMRSKWEGMLSEIDRRLGNLARGWSNDERMTTRDAEPFRPEQKLLEGAEAREEAADTVAAKPFEGQTGPAARALDAGGPLGSLTARGSQWSEAQIDTLRKHLRAASVGETRRAALEGLDDPATAGQRKARVLAARQRAEKLLIDRYGKSLDEIAKIPHDSDQWSTDPVLAAVRAEFFPFPDRATGGVTREAPKGFLGSVDPTYTKAVFTGDVGGPKLDVALDDFVKREGKRIGLGPEATDSLIDMAREAANFRLASMKSGRAARDVHQEILAHVKRDVIGNFGTTLLRSMKARDRAMGRVVATDPELAANQEAANEAARKLTWDEKHDPIAEIAAAREQMANELRKAGASEEEVVDALTSAAWSSIVDHAKAQVAGESPDFWMANAKGFLDRVLSESKADPNDPRTAVAWEHFKRELHTKAVGSTGRPKRGQTAAQVSEKQFAGRSVWEMARQTYEAAHGEGSWLKLTTGERKAEADSFRREIEPQVKKFRRVADEIGLLAKAGIETRRGKNGDIVYLNTGLGNFGGVLGDAFAGWWRPRGRPSDKGRFGLKELRESNKQTPIGRWFREYLTGGESIAGSDVFRHAMELEVAHRKSLTYRLKALEEGPLKPLIGASPKFQEAFVDLAEGFARRNGGEPVTDKAARAKLQRDLFGSLSPEEASQLRTAFDGWRGLRSMYRKMAAGMKSYVDGSGNKVEVDPETFGLDDYFPRISLGKKDRKDYTPKSSAATDPTRKAWNPFLQHRSGGLTDYALQPAEVVRAYIHSMEKSIFDHRVRQKLDPRIFGSYVPLDRLVETKDRAVVARKLNEWYANRSKDQRDAIKYDGKLWTLPAPLHEEAGGISLQLMGDPAQTTFVPWSAAGKLRVMGGGLKQILSDPRFDQVMRWRDHLLGRHEPTTTFEKYATKFSKLVSSAALGARIGTAQSQALGHIVMGNAAIGLTGMGDGLKRFFTPAGQRQLRRDGIAAAETYVGGGGDPLGYYSKTRRALRGADNVNMAMFNVSEKVRGAIYLGAYHQEKARIEREGLKGEQLQAAIRRGQQFFNTTGPEASARAMEQWKEIAAKAAGVAAMGRAQALYLAANTPGLLRTPLGKAIFALWRFPMMASGEAMRMARRDPGAAFRYVAGASALAGLAWLFDQDAENVTGTKVRNLELPFTGTLGEAIPALEEDGAAGILGSIPTPFQWRFDLPITAKQAGDSAKWLMAAGKSLLSDDPDDSIAFDADYMGAQDAALKRLMPGYDLAQRMGRALEIESPFTRIEQSGDPLKPWAVLDKNGKPTRFSDQEMFMRELLLPGRPKEAVRANTEYLKDRAEEEFEKRDRRHQMKVLTGLRDKAERTGDPKDWSAYYAKRDDADVAEHDVARSSELAKTLPWVRDTIGLTSEGRIDRISRRWKDRSLNGMTPAQLAVALDVLVKRPASLSESAFSTWMQLARDAGMTKAADR